MKLPRAFYVENTLTVAQSLLGCKLFHKSVQGTTVGRIVETEAYIGPHDQASHARNWLRSGRTDIQYKKGGHVYVYLIYGIHHCFNVVTAPAYHPEVVLVRALEPLDGLHVMARRRKLKDANKDRALTSGPGMVCQAMGFDMSCYGKDLCGDKIWLEAPEKPLTQERILATKRINIDYAGHSRDLYWRFIIAASPFVSVPFSG